MENHLVLSTNVARYFILKLDTTDPSEGDHSVIIIVAACIILYKVVKDRNLRY